MSLQAIYELQQCGVEVVSATKSNDWLSQGINLLMAEQYSRLLSRRMKDVRRWEAQQGRHVGPVPVGFDRVRGVLVPNDDIIAVVMLGSLYRTGQHSFATAADALNTAGFTIPDPKTKARHLWGKGSVEEVLKNVVYRGKVKCAGEVFDGKQPVIWDDATWEDIQAALLRRSTYRHTPEARATGSADSSPPSPGAAAVAAISGTRIEVPLVARAITGAVGTIAAPAKHRFRMPSALRIRCLTW